MFFYCTGPTPGPGRKLYCVFAKALNFVVPTHVSRHCVRIVTCISHTVIYIQSFNLVLYNELL